MWEKYFKTPFENDYNVYIKDANGHMIANFISEITKNSCDNVVNCLNNEYDPIGDIEFTLSKDKTKIMIGDETFLLIRGWGYLTGVGGCHLNSKEAIEVQDSLAEFICDKLNKKKQ